MDRPAVPPIEATEERVEAVGSDALDGVFDAHYQPMFGLAMWLTGDHSLAEDAVQDAFVDLVDVWPRLRDPGAAPAWLRRAVVSRCRSKLRRLAIGRRLGRTHCVAEEFGGQTEPDAFADVGPLAAAVGRLPRRQRECVVLRFYGDLKVAEIADALDIGQGSVKTHLHRATAQLRRELDAEDWMT